jgi:DNA-binding GntR family transcriptional regulator
MRPRTLPAKAAPKPTSRSVVRVRVAPAAPARSNRVNLSDVAYDRLEEAIVTCALRPGLHLSIQDLQAQTGVGRTPIHQAVSRLAADTIVVIRPRHGLQIAAIDLSRERMLLRLRREVERFVVQLATERAGASHRNRLLHIAGALRGRADTLTVSEFNQFDRQIDHLLIEAAGEPFLEHTLRPLHTLSRRIGWIYHSWVRADEGLGRTLACHLAILDAVAAGDAARSVAACDRLIDFCDSMFDVLGQGIDPALFDCNLAPPPA